MIDNVQWAKDIADAVVKRVRFLEEENQKLKDELANYNADARLQEKDKKIRELQRQLLIQNDFVLTPNEITAIDEWIKTNKLQNIGAIGGSFKYEFIPTSIGTIGTIKFGNREFTFRKL